MVNNSPFYEKYFFPEMQKGLPNFIAKSHIQQSAMLIIL